MTFPELFAERHLTASFAMQPIVELTGQHWLRSEALLRIQDADGQRVNLQGFLCQMQEEGQMPALDQWVVDQGVSWLDAHLGRLGGGRMHLNVFASSLNEPSFRNWLISRIAASQSSRWLCIEVTEQERVEDIEGVAACLRTLRDLGVEIALDDFGCGHMGWAMLFGLPADMIKLDAKLIADLSDSHTGRELLKSVIGVAKRRGLMVVAEGVETHSQLSALTLVGADFVQGYYFSLPQPESEILRAFSIATAVECLA